MHLTPTAPGGAEGLHNNLILFSVFNSKPNFPSSLEIIRQCHFSGGATGGLGEGNYANYLFSGSFLMIMKTKVTISFSYKIQS